MRDAIINRAKRAIIRRVRARHQQIKPVPTQGLFNFQCHMNCVQFVQRHPERKLSIWETVYVEDGKWPVLHYLVKDEGRGEFLEVTLGWQADDLEFYLIRQLLPDDHRRIVSEFMRSHADWAAEFVHPLPRWLFNIDRVM